MSLNNRAFTLVELLGVIIVLSVIAVIIYPVYNESITNSKNNLYNQQIKSLENASRRWGVENTSNLPMQSDQACGIQFSDLISGGYIADTAIINPKNNQDLTGCVIVEWWESNNQYKYTYSSTCQLGEYYDITTCPNMTDYDYCSVYTCGD